MPSHDDCVRELRDGARVLVRPIAPDDRAALAAGFARLSPESRFRRFLSPKRQLTEHDLDVLTRVDHHDHEALVALEAETGEGIGVARFVRTRPDRAEPAVVVADDWQGRGVGTLLLDLLAERAWEEGIRTFSATLLASERARDRTPRGARREHREPCRRRSRGRRPGTAAAGGGRAAHGAAARGRPRWSGPGSPTARARLSASRPRHTQRGWAPSRSPLNYRPP